MNADPLQGWIPVGLLWDRGRPAVDWRCFRGLRFTDPFFETTVARALRHPFRLLFGRQTPLETLEERAVTHPGISPSGFIFHMSRCGSTLIAQMLAASDANIVISEAAALDSVIYADFAQPGVELAERRRWLRAMIHALAQPRTGAERRFFVKFDARHAIDLPLIRAAFPDVPWIFVYRDPVEVLVSHYAQPALWTAPGIIPVRGMPWPPQVEAAEGDTYPAAVIGRICEAVLQTPDCRGLLVNYTELPDAVLSRVTAHFQCQWSPEEEQAMRTAAKRNAKNPAEAFQPDSRRKQSDASPRVREIAARFLEPLYRELESRRAAQPQDSPILFRPPP